MGTTEVPTHTTTVASTTQPETTEENVLPGTGTTTPTPVETTTTVEIIETTTEKIPATTTPVEVVVETTTTSEPGKLCQEPMDVDDVIDGIRTTQLPRLIASSNIPTGNIGRITSDQPWTPAATDDDSTEPWIQIEFDQEDEPVYIFGLVIKGAGDDTGKFVTKVRIESKLPGDEEFSPVTDDVTFDANTDDATPSNIYFTDEHQPILATVVRIYPVEWEGDEPAVRVGLLGCFKVVQTTTPVTTTTELVTTTTPVAPVKTTVSVVETTTEAVVE